MAKVGKQYRCIVKVDNNEDGSAQCLKYHVNDLLKFTAFLDKDYPDWRWYNVYDKSGEQLTSYTKFRRPVARWVGEQETLA